ncbi:anaerobic glycerol-3-phosphate dehydrogenase subunit C [Natronorubrum aibiense]|uniref:Anaerobic glycerol-3-phosphate dehydrogenase subunit C n=1 Tax=Natronorubrum aibiense TaxID=348826 RepID=A0A5P9NZG4_9EURY|nr:anaerobic glycerol-3-phosphate dehydrogenase subunit C [Natronorubrum aibiense]QFU81285.1 anaerobic glycerol-3-phosphate dehydrogenase subunit C [Natronorubrum aibiense]
MSDAEHPTDDGVSSDDEFEPIQVFPEAEEMDLRPGADNCYKCSTCDTNCPVAEVDDEFPGPKFQGPEQWRLKRQDDHDIDDSVMKCSNCMRCDSACPSEVPLSQMHNTARGEYVDEHMNKLSREYIRNRLLANYRRLAPLAATFPRTANFVMGLSVTQWLGEKTLGITSEREFPEFATETFREWWTVRGGNATSKQRAQEARAERGAKVENSDKRIAYFHGCYSNYNTPEVAKALVRVYEHFGYEVMVPDQACSGTPMFANGMLEDARRAAETNVSELADALEAGADIIASCSSCSMSIRQEYPELFDFEGTDDVAANTWDAVEYLRVHEDLEGELEGTSLEDESFAYHAPCHSRNQGLDGQTIEVLGAIDGIDAHDVGDSCSGISGTYGWKEENYETSMKIGEEMFEHMDDAPAETGLTECPTCSMQMEHGTGYEIKHTLEILAAALVGTDLGTDRDGQQAR